MEITVYTLFPQWFEGPLGDSVIGRARESGLLTVNLVNFREYATDRHQSVDDAPYGGGGGMVLRADVLARAMDATIGAPGAPGRPHVLYMSPRGRRFDQQIALRLARIPRLAILCGHYEAVDQRLIDTRVDEEVSLGDFVLTGGEIPAMAIVDAVARQLPGVLGNETSADKDSFMDGLLEGPHYTRPEDFEGSGVPEVLTSGDHGAIAKWREDQALEITRQRRPDLYTELLFHPEVVRRLARRGRPFAVYCLREEATPDILFASEAVRKIPGWQDMLPRIRGAVRGLDSSTRLIEVRDAKSASTENDWDSLYRELDATLAGWEEGDPPWPPRAKRFLRNLLRAMENVKVSG